MRNYTSVHAEDCLTSEDNVFKFCLDISNRAHEIAESGESSISDVGDDCPLTLAMRERQEVSSSQ